MFLRIRMGHAILLVIIRFRLMKFRIRNNTCTNILLSLLWPSCQPRTLLHLLQGSQVKLWLLNLYFQFKVLHQWTWLLSNLLTSLTLYLHSKPLHHPSPPTTTSRIAALIHPKVYTRSALTKVSIACRNPNIRRWTPTTIARPCLGPLVSTCLWKRDKVMLFNTLMFAIVEKMRSRVTSAKLSKSK